MMSMVAVQGQVRKPGLALNLGVQQSVRGR